MPSFLQLVRLLFQALTYRFRHRKSIAKLRSSLQMQSALGPVLEAFRRGDYEGALRAAEGLKPEGSFTPEYGFFRGAMLMQLGRFGEAEKSLRESVAQEKDNRKSALCYATLGELLLQQNRYDAALDCLDSSLRCWPERGSTQRAIAEVRLRQGNRASEAWQAARLAVDQDKAREAASAEVHNLNLGEDLATLAWAVAAASPDKAEVDRLVARAISLVGNEPVSSVAQVHYHSAQAYAALGDPGTSAYHLREAARVDPLGLWGRAARAAETAVSR